MRGSRAIALAAALLLVGALTACESSTSPPAHVVIASGGVGGVYHALGTAFAGAIRKSWSAETDVMTTAAAIENLRLVAGGQADVGFATVDSAALAIEGSGPFDESLPIVALAGLYDDYLQIVVRADGPLHEVGDLRGRRVSTGSVGSGTEVVANRVLKAAGIDIDTGISRHRLSAVYSAEALRSGQIDAFFFTGGLPTPAVDELARTFPIRLLPVGELAADLYRRYGDVYLPRSIPVNLYGLAKEVTTVGIPNVLVVRRSMSDADARALTALLFASKPTLVAAHAEARRLDRRAALATFPVRLHPGAAAYYRESKVLALRTAGTNHHRYSRVRRQSRPPSVETRLTSGSLRRIARGGYATRPGPRPAE
ncbi:TAXI family TRAP transporter solute-binding subunit [Actinomadura alba]|uniref:TAXI family TRAP transporter solute-binding subunit n=1 Tax=Actinomadura alba TaxID=406431 RepID=A0ABR7LN18_9ACTN|nr:TAXI family TRAP transporter solute-binding subunit [Actinomadura alba]MBC6465808.1 TAXI family TRAP transporter solute-binding subunit [Actinomadura alba]